MTAPAPTSSSARGEAGPPAGSRLDRAAARVTSDPRAARLWRWGAPAVVVLVAAVLRLVNLGHPAQLVFDETYYVKDAWALWNLGYESEWPEGADADFAAGQADGLGRKASFIAHPPLGKWIIALGMAAVGPGDPLGWRISAAVAGILLVVVTMLVGRLLFRSTALAVVAGGLLAIDGNAIVMSRVALLDGMLALFALLGAACVLLDRRDARRRLAGWMVRREADGRHTAWGPTLWWRPWLLAAGLAFGLAISVKWSGLYLLAVFGLFTVVADAIDRRRGGVAFWVSGTVLRQGPVSALLLVPIAALVHLVSWAGWFASDRGYYRHWVEAGNPAWEGGLQWVPLWFQNWWHYQAAMYGFHVGQSSAHSYESPAILWPLSIRPTSMHYERLGAGMLETITGIPNPLIWWAATAAVVFALVRLIVARDGRAGVVLVGVAAGWAPWLLYPERTMFQFYSIVYEPYLVLGIALAISVLLGSPADPPRRRALAQAAVAAFLLLCVALSAFFYPMWSALPQSEELLRMHYWFRTWI